MMLRSRLLLAAGVGTLALVGAVVPASQASSTAPAGRHAPQPAAGEAHGLVALHRGGAPLHPTLASTGRAFAGQTSAKPLRPTMASNSAYGSRLTIKTMRPTMTSNASSYGTVAAKPLRPTLTSAQAVGGPARVVRAQVPAAADAMSTAVHISTMCGGMGV